MNMNPPGLPRAGRKMRRTPYRDRVLALERQVLEEAIREAGGNRTYAARALGIKSSYFFKKVRDLGVEAPPAKRGFTLAQRKARNAKG